MTTPSTSQQGPAARDLVEVATTSPWCQRWRDGAHSWRHIHEGGFDARRYSVEPIDEATARAWVCQHHYSSAYPAASQRYGLSDRDGQLVGAIVLGIPMSERVLTNVFPDLEPLVEALELARMVLADEVPGNAESWFLARAFKAAAERGLRGVVAFADPVPRHVAGRVLFAGHTGHVYTAANAAYLGRATARTLTVLPDGAVLSARSAQKVRAGERGHAHVERQLVQLGATPRRPHADRAAWLTDALNELGATRIRHRGNHRYAFRLGRTARQRARVRLGMSSMPRPVGVDLAPAEQLALFAAERPTMIATMPGSGEDRP
jgi:hypothetical protein